LCGSKKNLTIDHIDGNGRNSKQPNNELSNLQTLCSKCHGSKDGKKGGRKYDETKHIFTNCLNCDKKLDVHISAIKVGKGKFCSKSCGAYFNKPYRFVTERR
jgi:hypothetical protein